MRFSVSLLMLCTSLGAQPLPEYGKGCGGATLHATGSVKLNTQVVFQVPVDIGDTGVFLIGRSRVSIPIGEGCNLYTTWEVSIPFDRKNRNPFIWPIRIPNKPELVGTSFFAQIIFSDRISKGRISATNGVFGVIRK